MTEVLLIAITLLIFLIFTICMFLAFLYGEYRGKKEKRSQPQNESKLTPEQIIQLKRRAEIERKEMENFFNYDGSAQKPIDR